MNIFRHEIRTYLRSTVIWTVTLSFMAAGFLTLFSAFSGDVDATKELLATYPPQVLAALNIQLDTFFSIYGFFAYLLTYLSLIGAMQAMNLGMGILSKETASKTADFLLVKPVNRFRVLTEKLSAALALILVTNLVYLTVATSAARFFATETLDSYLFFLIAVTVFFVQLFFLALGFFLAAVLPRIKSVLTYTLPIVFGLFILSLFGSVIGKEEINYFTPFKYFDSVYIIQNIAYEPRYLWVLGGVVAGCIVGSYFVFITKDIQAAS